MEGEKLDLEGYLPIQMHSSSYTFIAPSGKRLPDPTWPSDTKNPQTGNAQRMKISDMPEAVLSV